MSKTKTKKIKKPRLPIEAVLKLKSTHTHEPKKGRKRYNRKAEKETLKNLLETPE
ncbi:MAG: hypothetical protein HY756_06270 [Nitrospirae bacterium]|nr:hypothetical protein [Nitrospirota bacterium]